jgi:hypothetical protein
MKRMQKMPHEVGHEEKQMMVENPYVGKIDFITKNN